MITFRHLLLAALIMTSATTTINGEVIQLTSEEFYNMKEAGDFAAVVDVRRQDEWDLGHIANATFMNSLQNAGDADEIAKIVDLAGCENCPIAVYCRSGARAGEALEKLESAGFQGQLYNGLGVNQWEEAGYELVTGPSVDPDCKGAALEPEPFCAKSVAVANDTEKDPVEGANLTAAPSVTTAPASLATSSLQVWSSMSLVLVGLFTLISY